MTSVDKHVLDEQSVRILHTGGCVSYSLVDPLLGGRKNPTETRQASVEGFKSILYQTGKNDGRTVLKKMRNTSHLLFEPVGSEISIQQFVKEKHRRFMNRNP